MTRRTSTHRVDAPEPWRPWLVCSLLVGVTLAAYAPAWHGGLLWDDDAHLTRTGLRSVEDLWRIWSDVGATQQYYPVLHTVFWGLHRVFGDHTTGYHLLNIVLHAGSAFLFATLLRALRVPGATIAAVIFALHPVHVESVAWISELKNTLSGAWYLGAALAYLRFDAERHARYYVAAVLLFVLALLTKSVTATLPAALLVVFWWKRGSLRWRTDIVPLLPLFAMGIAAGLVTMWVERTHIGASGPAFDFTLIERALIAGRAWWFYLVSLGWPVGLTFVYPRWDVDQTVWWQYFFPIAVLVVVTSLWSLRARTRGPLALTLLFGGTLFPALGFFNVYPFKFSLVADHFQYLASLSVIAGMAFGLTRLAARWAVPGAAITVVIAALLGTITWRQSHHYVSAEALYVATIERNPDAWLAHMNLGWLRLQRGQLEAAVRDTQAALHLEPNLAQAQHNLGAAFRLLGRVGESERAYRAALELRPGDVESRYGLALALIDLGRPEEAEGHIAAYLGINPDDAEAHGQMGDVLQTMGRLDDAVATYRASLRLDARSARVHTNLGAALGRMGRLGEAIAAFSEALRLDPSYTPATENLAVARNR